MAVVGIETSCDETAIAIYTEKGGLLAHRLFSQIELHQDYGGVVPEIAARDHIRKLLPLLEQCLCDANLKRSDIKAVAYTRGPGLVGALMTGAMFAKALAFSLSCVSLGVHHLEAHLMAPFLEDSAPSYPFVALLVSGGHTMLIAVEAFGQYRLLGQSIDDAVGEAFDKTAKLMGLGYPGGPAVSALAEEGDPTVFSLPRPMLNRPGMDFSFSGLKTHVMQTYRNSVQDDAVKKNLSASFQQVVVDVLIKKSQRAIEATGYSQLVVAGGVSANRQLRQQMVDVMREDQVAVYFPRPEFSTDNGAMVAYCGYERFKRCESTPFDAPVLPRWPLDLLSNAIRS